MIIQEGPAMKSANKDIKTITDAIEHLEKAGSQTAHHFNAAFGKSFEDVKKAFENLKPYVENLKEKVEAGTEQAKTDVEDKVKENPWLALGLVAFVGLVIGWILGRDRR